MPTRNSHRSDSRDNGIQTSKDFLMSHDCIVTYLLKILEDCFDMNPLYGRTDYLRDIETLSRRYAHEGLSFATKTLPSLFDSLLGYLENGSSVYPSFKLKYGKSYPVFLQQLIAPIYEDHTSEHAVICMKCLYQLCVAFKKLKGPYKQSVLVKQLDEFVETDQALDITWSEYDLSILAKAKNLITKIVEGLNPFDAEQSSLFLPRPGPGATNSPTEKHMRYRPHVLYAQLSDSFDYNEWFFASHSFDGAVKDGPLDESPVEQYTQSLPKSDLLTSRFKFVHKTYGKPRCICIEQLEMQWLQQGIRRALYDRIEAHSLSKGYVSFTDQSINGLLALQSSCPDGIYSTIDMSAASDRISRKLVEFLFAGNKELLKALLCLSTKVIELPKDVPYDRKYLFAKKFAPMGSALCFPVMGLIHYALIKSIISMNSPQHIHDIPVWVYGDDIILHSIHAHNVFDVLPRFGMKLNREKSFVKSLFRESCGVHAYNGVNITPVRFKSIVHLPLSVNDLVSALENESALHKAGYAHTAKFIRSELLGFKGLRARNFPTVGPKSTVLGWIRDDEVAKQEFRYQRLKHRWHEDWQRHLYKVRSIVDLTDDSPPIEDDEYYLRKQVENPLETRMIDGKPRGSSIRWAWHPDSVFYHA